MDNRERKPNFYIWLLDANTIVQIMSLMELGCLENFFVACNKVMRAKILGIGGVQTITCIDIAPSSKSFIQSEIDPPCLPDFLSFAKFDHSSPKLSSPLFCNLTSLTYFCDEPRDEAFAVSELPSTLTCLNWYTKSHLFLKTSMRTLARHLPALKTLGVLSSSWTQMAFDAFEDPPKLLTSLSLTVWNGERDVCAQLPPSLTQLCLHCPNWTVLQRLRRRMSDDLVDLRLPNQALTSKIDYCLPSLLTRLSVRDVEDSEWDKLPPTLTDLNLTLRHPTIVSKKKYPKHLKILGFSNASLCESDVRSLPSHLTKLIAFDLQFDFSSLSSNTKELRDWDTLEALWFDSRPSFEIVLLSERPMRRFKERLYPPPWLEVFTVPNHNLSDEPLHWLFVKTVLCEPDQTLSSLTPQGAYARSRLPPHITSLTFAKGSNTTKLTPSALQHLRYVCNPYIELDSCHLPEDKPILILPDDAIEHFKKSMSQANVFVDQPSFDCEHLLKYYERIQGVTELTLVGNFFIYPETRFSPVLEKCDLSNAITILSRADSLIFPDSLTELSLGGKLAESVLLGPEQVPSMIKFPKNLKILTIKANNTQLLDGLLWHLPKLTSLEKLMVVAPISKANECRVPPQLTRITVNRERTMLNAEVGHCPLM